MVSYQWIYDFIATQHPDWSEDAIAAYADDLYQDALENESEK